MSNCGGVKTHGAKNRRCSLARSSSNGILTGISYNEAGRGNDDTVGDSKMQLNRVETYKTLQMMGIFLISTGVGLLPATVCDTVVVPFLGVELATLFKR